LKTKKEETIMATKKFMWVLLSFFIATWLLGSVSQTMAETWKFKFFNHVTKVEGLPIPDAEGHFVGAIVREGVIIFENGELAWAKTVVNFDNVKGVASFYQYNTTTFQDRSTITGYTKGTSGTGPFQFTGEIIHGTGRFQGIKGTVTATANNLPPEKGEIVGKSFGEATMTFTLLPK
jgi:hypothetical protein